jgi:hypothetical protein
VNPLGEVLGYEEIYIYRVAGQKPGKRPLLAARRYKACDSNMKILTQS